MRAAASAVHYPALAKCPICGVAGLSGHLPLHLRSHLAAPQPTSWARPSDGFLVQPQLATTDVYLPPCSYALAPSLQQAGISPICSTKQQTTDTDTTTASVDCTRTAQVHWLNQWKCPLCSATTTTKYQLRLHVVDVHMGVFESWHTYSTGHQKQLLAIQYSTTPFRRQRCVRCRFAQNGRSVCTLVGRVQHVTTRHADLLGCAADVLTQLNFCFPPLGRTAPKSMEGKWRKLRIAEISDVGNWRQLYTADCICMICCHLIDDAQQRDHAQHHVCQEYFGEYNPVFSHHFDSSMSDSSGARESAAQESVRKSAAERSVAVSLLTPPPSADLDERAVSVHRAASYSPGALVIDETPWQSADGHCETTVDAPFSQPTDAASFAADSQPLAARADQAGRQLELIFSELSANADALTRALQADAIDDERSHEQLHFEGNAAIHLLTSFDVKLEDSSTDSFLEQFTSLNDISDAALKVEQLDDYPVIEKQEPAARPGGDGDGWRKRNHSKRQLAKRAITQLRKRTYAEGLEEELALTTNEYRYWIGDRLQDRL